MKLLSIVSWSEHARMLESAYLEGYMDGRIDATAKPPKPTKEDTWEKSLTKALLGAFEVEGEIK